MTSKMGEDVSLQCHVAGYPLSKVVWTKEEGMSPDGRVKVKDGVLRIKRVAPGDEGLYLCQAENSVGFVTASLSLTVHGNI